MSFPQERPRRLRQAAALRRLVRETRLHPHDFMAPLFVVEGKGKVQTIASMPGQKRYSADKVVAEAEALYKLGVPAVLLFGVLEDSAKDAKASAAFSAKGPVPQALRALRKALPDLALFTDVCLCEYSDHGHCGVVGSSRHARGGKAVLNDPSLDALAKMALSHAEAGADFVAPSDMMDGRVGAIRVALDKAGHHEVGLMAYSAKFASAFYGPFRDAAGSAPSFGDRTTYQMDAANGREAKKELKLDEQEGADILMVKPAGPYLDVIQSARAATNLPLAAYQVSGEYSMICAAAEKGWLDRSRARDEALLGIKRAGADILISYFAHEWADDYRRRAGLDA